MPSPPDPDSPAPPDRAVWHALVAASADGVALLGPDGRVAAANRPLAALLGLPEEALAGVEASALAARLEEGAPLFVVGPGEVGTTVRLPDGRAASGIARPVGDGWRMVVLRQPPDAACAETIATLRHALRTPLTTLRGYLDLLREADPPPTPEDREQFMATMDAAIDRMLDILAATRAQPPAGPARQDSHDRDADRHGGAR